MQYAIEKAEYNTRSSTSIAARLMTKFEASSQGRFLGFRESAVIAKDASSSCQELEGPATTGQSFASQVYEHRQYLDRLVKEQLLSPALRDLAWDLWWKLSCSVDDGDLVAVPDAGPGPDGELIYIWKRGDHYFSVEMTESGLAEYFYLNDRTGETWDFECDPKEKPVPQEVVVKLTLFQKHS